MSNKKILFLFSIAVFLIMLGGIIGRFGNITLQIVLSSFGIVVIIVAATTDIIEMIRELQKQIGKKL